MSCVLKPEVDVNYLKSSIMVRLKEEETTNPFGCKVDILKCHCAVILFLLLSIATNLLLVTLNFTSSIHVRFSMLCDCVQHEYVSLSKIDLYG